MVPWDRMTRQAGQVTAADGDASRARTDEDAAPGASTAGARSQRIGGIGTGIARGLQAVFASPPDEVVIVAAVPGEPPDADTRLRVILDPDDPTKSIAVMPVAPADPPSE